MENSFNLLESKKGQVKQTRIQQNKVPLSHPTSKKLKSPLTCQLPRINRSGQATIFVIIAIAIVVGIVTFFLIRGNIGGSGVPAEFQEPYSFYLSCIREQAEAGLDLAGIQGGKIFIDSYEGGSEYAPFSSELNFLGFPVQYWYYISGNGIIKEQVPSKADIEEELERFIQVRLEDCDLDSFREQGYYIDTKSDKEVSVDVRIDKMNVVVDVNSELIIGLDESRMRKSNHEVEIQSKFGEFYDEAREIYDKQKNDAFLEDYAVDVLRNYAPVDDVAIQCSPKIWKTLDVEKELKQGLEVNFNKLKVEGRYYSLNSKEDEYYIISGINSGNNEVRFMYSPQWPTKIEIEGKGVDSDLIIAEPFGTQEGLGAMGFCYVPYHYVYDLSFPVMIQIGSGENMFQFPVVVILDNNVPRKAEFSGVYDPSSEEEQINLCDFRDNDVSVRIFDANLNKIDGRVSYECSSESCFLGETENGVYNGKVPACVNGFLRVRADGFAEEKKLFSTNRESSAEIILDREYEISVNVEIGGRKLGEKDRAIIGFTEKEGDYSANSVLPELNNMKLKEGYYEVSVYVYSDSELTIPASRKRECRDLPAGGLGGIFGLTKEECFDIEIPETKIESALIGGGKTETFVLESDLKRGNLVIKLDDLPKPDSLEQLQFNFESFDSNFVGVAFE